MLTDTNTYNRELLNHTELQNITEQQIQQELQKYLNKYKPCFTHPHQTKYFQATIQGHLSGLDRKTAEPIALHFLDPTQVRGLQDFYTRSTGWPQTIKQKYQTQLATKLTDKNGFLSVDECTFPKKGAKSAGVAKQYCGSLGKTENCQSGVFLSYASKKGYGLIDTQLYLPKQWFEEDHAQKRIDCHIPKETTFQTKNEIATQMINQLIKEDQITVRWVGCDAAFGCDHNFLDGLPDSVYYFAAVKENECVYLSLPTIDVPSISSGKGRKAKYPRALEAPIRVAALACDETIPWMRRVLGQGSKGPVVADVKCVRVFNCRSVNSVLVPLESIWVYVRKYEDGALKYFVSNAPGDTGLGVLDGLVLMRWSIEQCFLECKSYLGMGHYETRSYASWYRHMLLVFVAHFFVLVLRGVFKKRVFF